MKCVDCKFWKPVEGMTLTEEGEAEYFHPDRGMTPTDIGECHRQSPSPMAEALAVVIGGRRSILAGEDEARAILGAGSWEDRFTKWPTTLAHDFCGEFTQKPYRQGFV
jgi:hypothetical protein